MVLEVPVRCLGRGETTGKAYAMDQKQARGGKDTVATKAIN